MHGRWIVKTMDILCNQAIGTLNGNRNLSGLLMAGENIGYTVDCNHV